MYLGFDENTGLFYEGRSTAAARGIYPLPVITPASFSLEIDNPAKGLPQGTYIGDQKIVFREDSFDPVTRIRRGRFYSFEQQKEWHSTPHQVGENRPLQMFGGVTMNLPTFKTLNVIGSLPDFPRKQYSVALGSAQSPTLWTVIGIEMISSGEEMVTLKSRATLGSLPELLENSLPPGERNVIAQAFEKLSNDLYRAGPDSIVDHCRDLAEHILRAKVRSEKSEFKGEDLLKLIENFEKLFSKEYRNIPNCADCIRIHHQRRKTAIQDKSNVRLLMVQDAELCVYCVGSMLTDLGWARWV